MRAVLQKPGVKEMVLQKIEVNWVGVAILSLMVDGCKASIQLRCFFLCTGQEATLALSTHLLRCQQAKGNIREKQSEPIGSIQRPFQETMI